MVLGDGLLARKVEQNSEHPSCSRWMHEQRQLAAGYKTKYASQVEGVKLPPDSCA